MSGAAGPGTPRVVGDVLLAAAAAGHARYVFHLDDGPHTVRAAEVLEQALPRAARLRAHGVVPGDRVALVGSNRPEWVTWAFATWIAGATLVPLPAPVRVRDRAAYAAQVGAVVDVVGCSLVVGEARYLAAGAPWAVPTWEWDVAVDDAPLDPAEVVVDPDGLALVQASSGTTGVPKGIGLTHANVVARGVVPVVAEQGEVPRAQLLTWNPFFHMGGLTAILHTAMEGSTYHVLPPERFARDPREWLRLVGEVRATATGAPSSGWAAALRAVAKRPEGIDLSSLEIALFAMEMTDPDVVDQLVDLGGRLGLRPNIIAVAYGLTEGGGGASASWPGRPVRIDRIDLERFTSEGVAVPLADDDDRPAKRVVSCGASMRVALVEMRVGSPQAAVPERHVGEVLFRGDAVSSVRFVVGEHDLVDGWLRTGDVGYLADGELFLTGRSKELIIVKGRNYHPEDLEWAAGRVEGIEAEACVAFLAPPGAGVADEVVVVVELAGDPPEGVADQVRAAITNAVGVVVRDVVVVPPGTIPKAANGKLQRIAARDAYAAGTLA